MRNIFACFKERRMLKDRFFLVFLVLFFHSSAILAQEIADQKLNPSAVPRRADLNDEILHSTTVAETFYEIAAEIAKTEDITGPQAEQAINFLLAAKKLDNSADYIKPLLIKLACKSTEKDHSEQVYNWLTEYVNETFELDVLQGATQYLLSHLNSRQEREKLLEKILKDIDGKNPTLESELATLLGILKAEKADLTAAKSYLIQAYNKNRYSKLAFAKLAELLPDQVGPVMYLEHLRLVLRENPLNIGSAINFAQFAERLELYEVAAGAYEYCAELFSYLYPTKPLPPNIYLPWAISNYNTQQNQHKCLQIAKQVRRSGQFDILLEALAGKAAIKIGNDSEAVQIFQAAEKKAQQLLQQGPKIKKTPPEVRDENYQQEIGAKQFAWFYCFAVEDTANALDWANKAYSTEPNSPTAAFILAYALAMNQQLEWAKPLIENYEHNQISELVQAQIQLVEGETDSAIQTLKSSIARDPGSLAAEKAKKMLSEQGLEYTPIFNTDVILSMLENSFGQTLVPEFARPDEIFSVQLNLRGNKFSYGSKFDGTITIINNSSEPLLISNDSLLKGGIRIDAQIKGDLNKTIPKLVSRRIRSSSIEPGRGVLTTVPLVTGELRKILNAHPQALLSIEFTLYIDPAITKEGKITNRLVDIKPVKVEVKRSGIELTSTYLRNRFNSISAGQEGQKIKTAQLFVGLLKEQHAMAEHGTLYKFKYADWMPELLKSALLHESGLLLNPSDGEWIVKVQTMAEMLTLRMDHELISAVAKNINNKSWPVRMMAIYLLAKNADSRFERVLDWTAEYDSSPLVRDMAIALSTAETEEIKN
jgi:hypothetical protein